MGQVEMAGVARQEQDSSGKGRVKLKDCKRNRIFVKVGEDKK